MDFTSAARADIPRSLVPGPSLIRSIRSIRSNHIILSLFDGCCRPAVCAIQYKYTHPGAVAFPPARSRRREEYTIKKRLLRADNHSNSLLALADYALANDAATTARQRKPQPEVPRAALSPSSCRPGQPPFFDGTSGGAPCSDSEPRFRYCRPSRPPQHSLQRRDWRRAIRHVVVVVVARRGSDVGGAAHVVANPSVVELRRRVHARLRRRAASPSVPSVAHHRHMIWDAAVPDRHQQSTRAAVARGTRPYHCRRCTPCRPTRARSPHPCRHESRVKNGTSTTPCPRLDVRPAPKVLPSEPVYALLSVVAVLQTTRHRRRSQA
jgi:hypothetical protein